MLSVIILCTIFIILIIEIYSALKSFKIQNKEVNTHVQDNYDNKENYNSYDISNDKIIKLKPGKIYIKDNYNVFINISGKLMLMEKDVVYNIPTDFSLEIINIVNGENITYYYLSNK
tara:strand:- start:7734 stop:8084 length:351 start_codon:yes stop_codon:yes gene_type:complete